MPPEEDLPEDSPKPRRRWRRWLFYGFILLAGFLTWANGPGLRWGLKKVILQQLKSQELTGNFEVEGSALSGIAIQNLDLTGGSRIKRVESDSIALDWSLSSLLNQHIFVCLAYFYCQIDAVRVAGVNDVMAIILMAAKFGVPVCPHGGGIALCNMIQHYGMWDQIAVSGHSETQLVEYIEFLQDAVEEPVRMKGGHYVTPEAPGWGLEFREEFLNDHTFPDGKVWSNRPKEKCGVHFEFETE